MRKKEKISRCTALYFMGPSGQSHNLALQRILISWTISLVGRAPWPAADPLVGLLGRRKSRTRGSGADEGVRPTLGCGYGALWGRFPTCHGAVGALGLSPCVPVVWGPSFPTQPDIYFQLPIVGTTQTRGDHCDAT